MLILYIPFDIETDLMEKALLWKNSNAKEKIHIIQYGSNLNDNMVPIPHNSKVYILGHGACHEKNRTLIASSRENQTSFLDMKEVARRFESDFKDNLHMINVIKLYFCNVLNTQVEMANAFKNSLTDNNKWIDFYKGYISPPLDDYGRHKAAF